MTEAKTQISDVGEAGLPVKNPLEFSSEAFIRISALSANSHVGQAARLAIDCKTSEEGYIPSSLLQQLFNSSEHLLRIQKAAVSAHRGAHRGPQIVPMEAVIRFIPIVFTFAERMMSYDTSVLEEMIRLHRVAFVTGPKSMDPESRLKDFINQDLKTRELPVLDFEMQSIEAAWPVDKQIAKLGFSTTISSIKNS